MDKVKTLVINVNVTDLISAVKKREVLYSKESASVSKHNKKLREEAWSEVLRTLIPDCSELSDIEKNHLGKSTLWDPFIIS